MVSEHGSGDAHNLLASPASLLEPARSHYELGTAWSALQCPHASLAQPVPSFPTATAFLAAACEPLVGFEINVVGHDQHFYKKKK